jgi:hypothetical protein
VDIYAPGYLQTPNQQIDPDLLAQIMAARQQQLALDGQQAPSGFGGSGGQDATAGLAGLLAPQANTKNRAPVVQQPQSVAQASPPAQQSQAAPYQPNQFTFNMGAGGDPVVPQLLSGQVTDEQIQQARAQSDAARQAQPYQPQQGGYGFGMGGQSLGQETDPAQAAITRAAVPTNTFGYQSPDAAQAAMTQQAQQPTMTDAIVAKTATAISEAPGQTWQDKLATLPANPLFQIGLAIMGRNNQPIGEQINSGLQTAAKFAAYSTEQAQAKALQTFDPTKYATMQDAYRAAIGAGVAPDQALALAGKFNPQRTPVSLAPGAQLVDPTTGKVVSTNTNDPANSIASQIVSLTKQRDAFPVNSPNWKLMDAALGKVSGAADQQSRQLAQDNLQAQRETTNEMRKANMANVQAQRDQSNDFQVQKQATQLASSMEKSGIPQAQQALDTIQSIIQKYPNGLPGYGRVNGMLPNWALSEDGQQLRQAVATLANTTLKQRSGAAVTDQEMKRFQTELGTGTAVPDARLRQGVRQMSDLLDSQKRNYAAGASDDAIAAYEGNGGIQLSQYRTRQSSGQASSQGNAPSSVPKVDPAVARAELVRTGLIK